MVKDIIERRNHKEVENAREWALIAARKRIISANKILHNVGSKKAYTFDYAFRIDKIFAFLVNEFNLSEEEIMVKKGDEWKDLLAYIDFRTEHLRLERQKVPFDVVPASRERAIRKLSARLMELRILKKVVNEGIKSYSKYECSKVNHLNKMKIKHLKEVAE